MMAAALGTGIIVAGCGGAGSSGGGGAVVSGGATGGSIPPTPVPSPASGAPNGFRFSELVNSSTLTLPTQNQSQKLRAKAALKSSPRASSTFQAFTGSIELTNGEKIFFHAIDDQDVIALYQGTLDFSGPFPRILDVHRVMGQGDTLPDGTVISQMGRGQANADGTYVSVITQEGAPPSIYIGNTNDGFKPFANMGDTTPGGGGYLGGDFSNLAIDDKGNVGFVSSFVPDGTAANRQGLAYVIQNDPNHPGSGILFSTQDVVPDGPGTMGGIGLVALSGSGHYVAQTTLNGVGIEGGGQTQGQASPSPSPSPSASPSPVPDTSPQPTPGTAPSPTAPLDPVSIAVSPPSGTIITGKKTQLSARATFTDGTLGDVTAQVTWTSDNTAAATVSSGGLVTAVADGVAVITATLKGFSGTATLKVASLNVFAAQFGGTSRVVTLRGLDIGTLQGTPGGLGLSNARGCCVDVGGRIYIADTDNNRVIRVDGISGANPVILTGDATTFSSPQGLALDKQGRLYVADSGNSRIIRFDGINGLNPISFGTGLMSPLDVFVDGNGRIYGADSTLQKLFAIDDMNGTNLVLFPPTATLEVAGANAVTVDASGRIYGSSPDNSQIVRIDNMSGANLVNFTTAAAPKGVVVDVTGAIWFTTNATLNRMDDMVGTNLQQASPFDGLAHFVILPNDASVVLAPAADVAAVPAAAPAQTLPNAVIVHGIIGQPQSRKIVAAGKAAALNPLLKVSRDVADGTAIYGPRITSGGIPGAVLHLDASHLALYYNSTLVAQTDGKSPLGNTIASFSPPVCGSENRIYYVLICVETAELVMYDGSTAKTILARGDKVGNRTVNGLNFGLNQNQADLHDRLILIIEYDDGTSGIVVGLPV